MEEFKTRLARAIDHAGFKDETEARRALIEALDVSKNAVSKLIRGGSNGFSAENVFKAARLLKVNPEWLATGEGEMVPELTPEARRIAEQIDYLKRQPERRAWALRVCEIATFTKPPSTPEESFAWVAELAAALPATVPHPPGH